MTTTEQPLCQRLVWFDGYIEMRCGQPEDHPWHDPLGDAQRYKKHPFDPAPIVPEPDPRYEAGGMTIGSMCYSEHDGVASLRAKFTPAALLQLARAMTNQDPPPKNSLLIEFCETCGHYHVRWKKRSR